MVLLAPLAISWTGIFLARGAVDRKPGSAWLVLAAGWLFAGLVGAAAGAVLIGLPFHLESDLPVFPNWLSFMAPFVLVGVISALLFLKFSRRRGSVTHAEPGELKS
ncbi:hypothetical protein [Microbacterium sp. NPDC056052]|uniref:hypothetical protein n=1 Tax=Microbacterium sp. NPDC056052 TaxID=3345695 RepID=UPI0035E0C4B6